MADVIKAIVDNVLNPIIALMFGFAVIVFLWGVFRFISSEEGKDDGKRNMLWGIIGFFIMVSAYAIVGFIRTTLGV